MKSLFFIFLFFSLTTAASPIPLARSVSLTPGTLSSPKLGEFFKQGTVTGGQALAQSKDGFSILRIQKLSNAAGVERIILSFGDTEGLPLRVQPGFFHLTVDYVNDSREQRVILDLAQVQKTTIDQQDLKQVFKDSPFVKTAEISMDPVEVSTNITLQMKKQAQVRAYIEKDPQKINQLVIDFQ
jgi:hypothetical protein